MDHQVIDDALSEEDFKQLKDAVLSDSFPWFFHPRVSTNEHEDDVFEGVRPFYFYHMFYCDYKWNSNVSFLVDPIISILNPKAIIRVKANLYTNVGRVLHHKNHTDLDFSSKAAIFYLNTNNGPTVLNDKIEIEAKENRLVLFNGSMPHRSTSCSNQQVRVNINFNYL